MLHKSAKLAPLFLSLLLVNGCKNSAPSEIQGKWIASDFLTGTTKIQFRDGEMEANGRVFDAKYQTDNDGIIIEIKDEEGLKKVRIKFLDDKTINYGGMTLHRSNN
jgi:hypothetical protein